MHTKEQGFAHYNVTRNPQKKSCNEKQEGIHEDARVSHCESIRLLRHAPTTWVNGAFQRRGDTLSGIRALCLCLFTSHHRYRQAGDCPTLIDLLPLHGAHTPVQSLGPQTLSFLLQVQGCPSADFVSVLVLLSLKLSVRAVVPRFSLLHIGWETLQSSLTLLRTKLLIGLSMRHPRLRIL